MKKIILFILLTVIGVPSIAQKKPAPKPLYDDPVYHGAPDPVIIYNITCDRDEPVII